MIIKRKSSRPGFIRVCFELPAYLWADRVYVVGDFNNWDRQHTPLHQDRDGVWRAEVDLPCGKCFQFRYYVDNHWLTDNHADGMTDNPYGTQNSIVETNLSVTELRLRRVETPSLPILQRQKQTDLLSMD